MSVAATRIGLATLGMSLATLDVKMGLAARRLSRESLAALKKNLMKKKNEEEE